MHHDVFRLRPGLRHQQRGRSQIAIDTQIGFAASGFAPTIARTLVGESRTDWLPVAVCCAVSALSPATARETYRVPLTELGKA
ncbi:hypothetical protein AB4305_29725 [Nocardia sp. 2YAB30]|uniref:hypothetical protein n=1 Tax=Nocardia sp. 2YAB30 TaxID=3233022 RepID=UPI003F9854A8